MRDIGGGRRRKEDQIDFTAGLVLHKKEGEKVSKGDPVATAYTSSKLSESSIGMVTSAFTISNGVVDRKKRITKILQ